MTVTVDWNSRIVNSTASITDIVAFKDTLRDLEDNDDGILYPQIVTYKRLDLGGGAFFHAVDFINGYQLRFPSAGNYMIIGNVNASIVPVAGVFVDRVKSAAFATGSGSGGSGPTANEIWNHVVESGKSASEILRLIVSHAAGAATGLEGQTPRFKSLDGTKTRIDGTYIDGERSITALDSSP